MDADNVPFLLVTANVGSVFEDVSAPDLLCSCAKAHSNTLSHTHTHTSSHAQHATACTTMHCILPMLIIWEAISGCILSHTGANRSIHCYASIIEHMRQILLRLTVQIIFSAHSQWALDTHKCVHTMCVCVFECWDGVYHRMEWDYRSTLSSYFYWLTLFYCRVSICRLSPVHNLSLHGLRQTPRHRKGVQSSRMGVFVARCLVLISFFEFESSAPIESGPENNKHNNNNKQKYRNKTKQLPYL